MGGATAQLTPSVLVELALQQDRLAQPHAPPLPLATQLLASCIQATGWLQSVSARASPGLSAAVRGAETLGTQRSPYELELGTRWSRGKHAVAGWRAGREVQKKRC